MLQRIKPTKAIGKGCPNCSRETFSHAAGIFLVLFQYGHSNINNNQKHGIKACYGENGEYKEWLQLILGSYLEHSNNSYSEVLTFKIMLIVKVSDGIKDMFIING